jgi:hypothetical protein
MPVPKGWSPAKKAALKRCEAHLEGKPGINKYAVCRASVGRMKAMKRRLERGK